MGRMGEMGRIGRIAHVRSNDFSRLRVTWRQPSHALLKEAIAPVPKQLLNPLMVSVMASAMTREQRLKSLLQTSPPSPPSSLAINPTDLDVHSDNPRVAIG